ncbi:MAG: ComF family protein [Spirochaetia bacterium]
MKGKERLAVVLEVLFPGRCLLCGRWLLEAGSRGTQVCADCLCSLIPLSGRRCDVCGALLVSERGTCIRCRNADFAFSSNRSVFSYSGAVRDLISCLKFERRYRLSALFAGFLAPRILSDHPGVPVVPVPGRKAADAVELIARRLESSHGIPVLRLLKRSGGQAQKTLDLRERRENLRGRILDAGLAAPPEAVLFDDVFTTGATADTCARVLMQAGCRKVSVVSIAMEE